MKGQILDFSVQTNSGVISAESGARHNFSGAEWKDSNPPARGAWVDFEVNDAAEATGIYRALGTRTGALILSKRSKPTATLLAIFLGGLGAHKFYMGSWGWGIVYLATCWLWIPSIVAVVEGIRMILLTDDEFRVRSDAFSEKGPFGFFW